MVNSTTAPPECQGEPEENDRPKPNYYAIIPAEVRYDKTLRANEKLLYAELSAWCNLYGVCTASTGRLAELFEVSPQAIKEWLRHLEEHNYIRREIQRKENGEVAVRKIYVLVSATGGRGSTQILPTPATDVDEGGQQTLPENIIYIYNNKKKIKKEKVNGGSRRSPLTDDEMKTMIIEWIGKIAAPDWSSNVKNRLYAALVRFYEPRTSKAKDATRSKTAFTGLTNRLCRFSGMDPAVMEDLLDRATSAEWIMIYPDKQAQTPAPEQRARDEEWL